MDKNSIKKILKSTMDEDPVEFKKTFETELKKRIDDKIREKKSEIIKNIDSVSNEEEQEEE